MIVVMAALLLVADQLVLRIHPGVLQEGPFDETAHFLTGALVLVALPRVCSRSFAVGLLVASVAIDLDHVPGLLGYQWITRTTPRPYPHSLLTLALVGLSAFAWATHRRLLVGAAVGLSAHFIRDLSESSSGVPLLWPWSSHSYTLPHWTYQGAMAGVVAVALARAWRRPSTSLSG
jgi:LexA-binding, inner membrane-associated putative hydrolase